MFVVRNRLRVRLRLWFDAMVWVSDRGSGVWLWPGTELVRLKGHYCGLDYGLDLELFHLRFGLRLW